MCDASAGCARGHTIAPGDVLLRDHLRASTCGPDCDCACHEDLTHGVAHPAALTRTPVRRQHTAWRLAHQIYSDRWTKAAA